MGEITSLYVYKVAGQASSGVETDDLVRRLGLDPEGPIDPARMVPSADYYRFFAALAERDPDGLRLPFRIGASMRCDEYGAFGLAWKSAPDLKGSLTRAERYARVLSTVEVYTLDKTDAGALFVLDKKGDNSPGMVLSNEASMASVLEIIRQVATSPFTPCALYLKHEPRGPTSVYEYHFGCPVHFEADRNAFEISDEALDTSNKLGDATIARFFDRHLDSELAALADDAGLEKRVKIAVGQALSEGVPTISGVAKSLAMSARTLQRRLAEKDISFQALVDSSRRDLAQQLLRETTYSLAEIAFLTGFAEQSGFTRAFKRWAGQTPRSYRLGAQRG
ncbi:AraC family transcriptional regulator [Parvularcula lutaonensis]|uniref:AraC family transcriptional regulator n=1 Tax=Parvularcula lutaonensis TaxID=491923 RepID=A0ABV7MEJ6_9PROT|nr:AraC family transcriptional regulator [Parvularcula lutaonensis]GGY52880.1 transcriptional regulator [Parvularcula lutaonensis]